MSALHYPRACGICTARRHRKLKAFSLPLKRFTAAAFLKKPAVWLIGLQTRKMCIRDRVFGSEGDWILVQYDITDTHNRIGYIYKNALPADVTVPELNLTNVPAIVHYDVEVTDDPVSYTHPMCIRDRPEGLPWAGRNTPQRQRKRPLTARSLRQKR